MQHTLTFTSELPHGQLLNVTVDVEVLDQIITTKRARVDEIIPPLLPTAELRPRLAKVSDEIRLRRQEWADALLVVVPPRTES